jgi:hypothetical protein
MKRAILALAVVAAGSVAVVAAAFRGPGPEASTASSHREAPLIAEDPTADNTDLYAFRSPDRPSTVTIVSNWIPGEDPAAGPNYFTFSDSARYYVYIDRNGDARPDITYETRFQTPAGPLFLGNTAQNFTLRRNGKVILTGKTPPNNIGPRQTPNYPSLVGKAIYDLPGGGKFFAGQRDDAFYGDIGAIFDLVAFRKATGNMGGGRDFFAGYNVHTISLQLPISQIRGKDNVIGLWSSTERQNVTVDGKLRRGWTQVSRLGNPLVNEVVVPTAAKDQWNRESPATDGKYKSAVENKPLLAVAMNQLYKLGVPETGRDDLTAIFLTGVPKLNYTGTKLADMLRLNTSISVAKKENRMGVLGGDTAGFPNGRRLGDDVIDIGEQAVAGFLKGKKVPLGDGVNANDRAYLKSFPYQAHPHSGFANSKGQQKA